MTTINRSRSVSRSARSSSSSSSDEDDFSYEFGTLYKKGTKAVRALPAGEQEELINEQRLCNLRNMVRLERQKARLIYKAHQSLISRERAMEQDIGLLGRRCDDTRKEEQSPCPLRFRCDSPPPPPQQQRHVPQCQTQSNDEFDLHQASYMRGASPYKRSIPSRSRQQEKVEPLRRSRNSDAYIPAKQPQEKKRQRSPEPALEKRLIIHMPAKRTAAEPKRVICLDAGTEDVPQYSSDDEVHRK